MDKDKYIGKKLEGRYEITELIGVGGMADVYKATDIIDNKIVAVKILKKEFVENEEFLRRFRNESKAIALLSHPNIVKVYDVGFSDKLQFIVMEYIDGITLKEYMDNEKVLTWKDSVHFIIQILRALQHAHDRGIVHRDIKPQNIMLFTDGTIKVMDFGIAKFARDEGTSTDQAIGTVHYISPEQARGDETDEKSDIYSVGVMLYEMLTGQKPFDSDKPISIAVMHMQNTPERPRAINPDIPPGLEEIILRAMEKDAENRYQTAADMIRDIEAFKANTSMTFGYYVESVPEEQPDSGDTPTQYFSSTTAQQAARRQQQEEYDDYDDDEYYEDDEDEEEEEETEQRSLFVPVMTAVTIAFIVVAVFFVLWLIKGVINKPASNSRYEMPNLVGMDYYEAKDTYGYLDIQIQESDYSEYEKDAIYFQDIQVGDTVPNGQTVYVNVSLGVSMVTVQDVAGYYFEYAEKVLRAQGFETNVQYELSSENVEASKVIRTEPAAGEEAESGSTIIIYVSKGIDTNAIEVRDYTGWELDKATTDAEYYGLEVGEPVAAPSLEEEGTIIGQSIEAGETVESGTAIIFTYSNGEDPEGIVSFQMPIPAGLAPGRYVLDFIDGNGLTLCSSPTINTGYTNTVKVDVEGTGSQQVVVVLTNYENQKQAEVGVYNFDFANRTFTKVRENIAAAFDAVQQPTEPPVTEPPATQPPVVDQPPVVQPTQPPTPPQTEPQEPVTDPATPPMPDVGDADTPEA